MSLGSLSRSRGFTLLELVVAMGLGVLVSTLALTLLLAHRQNDQALRQLATVQDNGRFAIDYLKRQFAAAGYGATGAIAGVRIEPLGADIGLKDGTYYDETVIAVSGGRDCVGTGVMTGFKRFRVTPEQRLLCTAYEADGRGGWVADDAGAVIDQVAAFQVLYGIDVTSRDRTFDGVTDGYVTGSTLLQLGARARVNSMQVGLLLTSPWSTQSDASGRWRLLDQWYASDPAVTSANRVSPRQFHRPYSMTVALRNRGIH